MKFIVLGVCALISILPSLAFADGVINAGKDSTVLDLSSPQSYQTSLDEVSQALIIRQAEAEGWCERPNPLLKKGEVAIIWTRDVSGKCSKQSFLVGK